MQALKIGIVGAGIGGLTAANALLKLGHDVQVYEQAKEFFRIGADINLTPNAVRALDGVGEQIAADVRASAARPAHRISRMWDTNAETSRLPMSDEAERQYGAPQLTIHRADLLAALANAFPAERVHFAKRAQSIEETADGVQVQFTDGSQVQCDVLIGADGIHSVVRNALFPGEKPRFTGVVSFRTVFPTERVKHIADIDSFIKWWGPTAESQIVTFPLNQGQDTFVFATAAQDSWQDESWTMEGDIKELRQLYADFPADARALLDAADEVFKTAHYERDPLPHWSKGKVSLLGDACHPMMPFMAQGAGMAIEDSVVLARCLAKVQSPADVAAALVSYENTRKERASRIQVGSRGNQWLREGGNADWVYGYDSWQVPLA